MGLSVSNGVHQFVQYLLHLTIGEIVFLHKFFVREAHSDIIPQLTDADVFHCLFPLSGSTGFHVEELGSLSLFDIGAQGIYHEFRKWCVSAHNVYGFYDAYRKVHGFVAHDFNSGIG